MRVLINQWQIMGSRTTISPPSVCWSYSEPGLAEALHEIRCVQRRARKRWFLVLVITCILSGIVAIFISRHQRQFLSTIVIRVGEEHFGGGATLPTPKQLQQHVMQVALSRQALLAIADKFNLYKEKRRLDPGWTEQLVREAIELDVLEDDFEFASSANSTRTARIAVSFAAPDPELALKVVRHLGSFIESKHQEERRALSRSIARAASDGVELLQQELLRLYQQQTALRIKQQSRDTSATTDEELRRISALILQNEIELNTYEVRTHALHLRSDFESQEHGLRFETIDPGRIARVILTDRQRTGLYTCCSFLVLIPLISLALGVFDSRARDSHGLIHIGVLPLGEVPAFDGMDCGAWARRSTPLRGEK